MNKTFWDAMLDLLDQDSHVPASPITLCVGCWYMQNHAPFPEVASSSLCTACAEATRQRKIADKGVHHCNAMVLP